MVNQKLNVSTLLLVLLNVLGLISPHVSGRSHENPTEGTVKTIKGNNGEVVDCVDMYKQPALNHPLLKHHNIQKDSSSLPSKINGSDSELMNFIQPWHENGLCSEGSVPIRRRRLQDTRSSASITGPHFENAGVAALPTETRFYGGGGELSVWNPAVSRLQDFSTCMLMVILAEGATISAGWIVHPEVYGDFQTRFFVHWTTDDNINTGCFDVRCDGFVQVNERIALGSPMESVSTIGAKTFLYLKMLIFQDEETGNWWLRMGEEAVGYWPAALFRGIPKGAERIYWGGQIFDSLGNGQHTETDMGNGLFPDVRTNEASSVCSLEYVDGSFTRRTLFRSMLRIVVTNSLCYNAQVLPSLDPQRGLCFLFGGSGRNPGCP